MADASHHLGSLSSDAFASLGSMEGIYEPIVEITYVGPLTEDAFASFGSMEGLAAPTAAPAMAPPVTREASSYLPGYLLASAAAVAAYVIHLFPVAPFQVIGATGVRHPISAAIIAIVIGVAIRNLWPVPGAISAGCKRIVKKLIPVAIVLTGAGLDLGNIAGIGVIALGITVICIGVAFGAAYLFGRWFGLSPGTAILIGAGTGICGNSAIVAVAPLIDADDEELVLSIGTINLFGLLAMLACPLLGGMLGMGDEAFGVWTGTSIHAVPQVVAAGFAHSADAGMLATLVKLVRVTLLAPLVAGLAIYYARRHSADVASGRNVVVHYARFVPWFVWGFVLLALLNTVGVIPTLGFDLSEWIAASAAPVEIPLADILKRIAKVMLTLAMAAIGLELNLRVLARVGGRALATGLAASCVLAATSLALVGLLM